VRRGMPTLRSKRTKAPSSPKSTSVVIASTVDGGLGRGLCVISADRATRASSADSSTPVAGLGRSSSGKGSSQQRSRKNSGMKISPMSSNLTFSRSPADAMECGRRAGRSDPHLIDRQDAASCYIRPCEMEESRAFEFAEPRTLSRIARPRTKA